jgi:hypothetical protein
VAWKKRAHALAPRHLRSSHRLNVVTLALAIAGVVLALASLAWQASAFLLAGSRVRVRLRYGGLGPEGDSIVWNFGERPNDFPLPDTYTEVVVIEVTNSGRTDVDVLAWGVEVPPGITVSGSSGDGLNPPLGRLQHGSQRNWFVEYEAFQSIVDNALALGPIRATGLVRLANGKTKRGKPTLMEKTASA